MFDEANSGRYVCLSRLSISPFVRDGDGARLSINADPSARRISWKHMMVASPHCVLTSASQVVRSFAGEQSPARSELTNRCHSTAAETRPIDADAAPATY